jgi:hypothetical protein
MSMNPIRWLRQKLRNALFAVVRRIAQNPEGRDILVKSLEGVHAGREIQPEGFDSSLPTPYSDVAGEPRHDPVLDGEGAVIITGRFRSGSTLLWNLFRHMTGFTSYYEPHNERRWFDPPARGDRVDATHKKVSDYWAEYEGLSELGRYYHEEWTHRHLFMDADSWDADLLAYTRILLTRAKGRPVLQCNRIDFRLGWHRRHFPLAKIVHLFRHPRDQWCSALMDTKRFPSDARVEEFEKVDGFYLLSWCRDLKLHFPFLDDRTTHPYQLFYFLWKLSYLYGRHFAHYSVAMEELIGNPDEQLRELFAALDIDPAEQDLAQLKGLIVKPEMGKWKGYASDEWFRRHEEICEQVLADFFRNHEMQREPITPASFQCVP